MTDDAALVEAWRDGDRAAGPQLFERYFPSIARFFRNKVGPEHDDLVQATFLACFEGLPRMRGTSFRSYLFAIACNMLRRHYTAKSRNRIDLGTVSAFDMDPSPSTVMGKDERQRHLAEALRRIPVELQIVLELHYWESMTAAEIAEATEVPLGTAKTRIRRARTLLREQLQRLDVSGLTSPASADDGDALEQLEQQMDTWARDLRDHVEPSAKQ